MRIKYTNHGTERGDERAISRSDVEYVLKHFDMSMPGRGRAVKYLGTLPDGRRVAVVLVRPFDVTKVNVVKTTFPVE